MVLAAKGYYIVGIYAALLALGAVAIERAATWCGDALRALGAIALVSLPLSLPVLPVPTLIAYMQALGLTGRDGAPAASDSAGLRRGVRLGSVGERRRRRLHRAAAERARTHAAIYADTYADAGAIDFFGPRYGLPAAISSQNNYYLWGTRGYDGRELIAIGATRIDLLRRYYRSVTLVRTSSEPLKWIVEGPSPIYLCRDPVAPLRSFGRNLRWYGA